MAEPSVCIVVLHYGSVADTIECVASLARQKYGNFHTLVVDNGSHAGLTDSLASYAPAVETIELPDNLGWSGGNNVGIDLALERGYDFIWLLNNDTAFPDGTIEALMRTAGELPAGVLHPAIYSYFEDNEAQLDPSISEPATMATWPVAERPGLYKIGSINGSCFMVHASVFRTIGTIDARYFLQWEETDFATRATKAGYSIYCDVSVRIQHKESRAFGARRKPLKTYYSIRNQFLYMEKHLRTWRKATHNLQQFYWTLWQTADATGMKPGSWWGVLRWVFSADLFARAVRMGLRDYVLRRFGRLNRRDETILLASTSKPAPPQQAG